MGIPPRTKTLEHPGHPTRAHLLRSARSSEALWKAKQLVRTLRLTLRQIRLSTLHPLRPPTLPPRGRLDRLQTPPRGNLMLRITDSHKVRIKWGVIDTTNLSQLLIVKAQLTLSLRDRMDTLTDLKTMRARLNRLPTTREAMLTQTMKMTS